MVCSVVQTESENGKKEKGTVRKKEGVKKYPFFLSVSFSVLPFSRFLSFAPYSNGVQDSSIDQSEHAPAERSRMCLITETHDAKNPAGQGRVLALVIFM